MKNFVQPGKVITFIADAAINSGDLVVRTGLIGVACNTAAIGKPVDIDTSGVYTLPKTTDEAWAFGDPVFWNAATSKLTKTNTGSLPRVGNAVVDALSADATGTVRLNDRASNDADIALANAGIPANITFTIAAGSTNVAEVLVKPVDAAGNLMTGVRNLHLWLSDDSTGVGLTGTTASGTVTTKTSEGAVLETSTAKKSLQVQTKAAGSLTLQITDTAKTGFYVAVRHPATGKPIVSRALVAADYGA